MDHLQCPKAPAYTHLQVPYLGFSYTFDSCIHVRQGLCENCQNSGLHDWSGFPERMGYNGLSVRNGSLSRSSTEPDSEDRRSAFPQAWLYFGVIASFFNDINVIPNFLRQTDGGSIVINTSGMTQRLLLWRNDVESMPAREKKIKLLLLDRMLGELDQQCAIYIAGSGLIDDFSGPLSPEISLSIQVLGETLNHAAFMAGGSRAPYTFGIWTTPLMVQRLKENFWCPMQIQSLGRICITYYATLMGPRYPQVSHEQCTEKRCHILDIDENSYKTKHVEEDCECEHISVQPAEIIAILDKDQIPIVTWSGQSLKISASTRQPELLKVPYLAISHVWADGLGNPRGNSLPYCQIKRIQDLANACFTYIVETHNSPVWFWMDTLCVPITEDKRPRKIAISRINQTFQEAAGTLVIDSELIKRSSECSDTELGLRIAFSRWAQRLWTLQEAVATTAFYVQFADRCVSSKKLEANLFNFGEKEGINDPLLLRAYKWFRDISKLHSEPDRDTRLLRTFQATPERTTSHERDELICTAGLIGFDQAEMRRLLDTVQPERIITFMKTLGKAPRNIIFGSEPRLPYYGFQWCPQHLLSAYHRVASNISRASFHKITENGLQGTWSAIRFRAPSMDMDIPPDSDMNIDDIILNNRERSRWHWVSPIYSTAADVLKSIHSRDLAILLEGLSLFEEDQGCLVEVVKEEGEVTFARRLVPCHVQFDQPASQNSAQRHLIADLVGPALPIEGDWCIQ